MEPFLSILVKRHKRNASVKNFEIRTLAAEEEIRTVAAEELSFK